MNVTCDKCGKRIWDDNDHGCDYSLVKPINKKLQSLISRLEGKKKGLVTKNEVGVFKNQVNQLYEVWNKAIDNCIAEIRKELEYN